MYYLVYKITHKKSNYFYIGRHVTDNIQDNYLGSGSHPILKDKRNLSKEILLVAKSQEEMIDAEIKFIKENISDPNCVNFIIGDPTYRGVVNHSAKSKEKIKQGIRKYKESNPQQFIQHMSNAGKALRGRKQSKEHIKKLSEARKGVPKSAEFKSKVSKTLSGRLNRPRNTLCKKWKITDTVNKTEYTVEDRVEFCKQHNLNYASFNVGTRNKVLYKKKWLCEKVL